jgi:hypothetical protein
MQPNPISFLFVRRIPTPLPPVEEVCSLVGRISGLRVARWCGRSGSSGGGVQVSRVLWSDGSASSGEPASRSDWLIAENLADAVRWLAHLRPREGRVVTDAPPLASLVKAERLRTLRSWTVRVRIVDARLRARTLGDESLAPLVLLGALSLGLEVEPRIWSDTIEAGASLGRRTLACRAFWAGRSWRPGRLPAGAGAPVARSPVLFP